MLDLLEIHMDKSVLSDLLQSFQPIEIPNSVISGTQPIPLPGTTEYLYLGAFSFLEGVLNIGMLFSHFLAVFQPLMFSVIHLSFHLLLAACSFSFMLASESLLTLESIVISLKRFLDKLEGNGKSTHSGFIQGVLRSLCNRLGTSAEKLLKHNWDDGSLENGWKNRV